MHFQPSLKALAVAAGIAATAAVVLPAQAQTAHASGKVVRVDARAGKIAIQHGAISKLDLPAMTLVYHVDPKLLEGIQAGDTVKFTAERTDNQYRITELSK